MVKRRRVVCSDTESDTESDAESDTDGRDEHSGIENQDEQFDSETDDISDSASQMEQSDGETDTDSVHDDDGSLTDPSVCSQEASDTQNDSSTPELTHFLANGRTVMHEVFESKKSKKWTKVFKKRFPSCDELWDDFKQYIPLPVRRAFNRPDRPPTLEELRRLPLSKDFAGVYMDILTPNIDSKISKLLTRPKNFNSADPRILKPKSPNIKSKSASSHTPKAVSVAVPRPKLYVGSSTRRTMGHRKHEHDSLANQKKTLFRYPEHKYYRFKSGKSGQPYHSKFVTLLKVPMSPLSDEDDITKQRLYCRIGEMLFSVWLGTGDPSRKASEIINATEIAFARVYGSPTLSVQSWSVAIEWDGLTAKSPLKEGLRTTLASGSTADDKINDLVEIFGSYDNIPEILVHMAKTGNNLEPLLRTRKRRKRWDREKFDPLSREIRTAKGREKRRNETPEQRNERLAYLKWYQKHMVANMTSEAFKRFQDKNATKTRKFKVGRALKLGRIDDETYYACRDNDWYAIEGMEAGWCLPENPAASETYKAQIRRWKTERIYETGKIDLKEYNARKDNDWFAVNRLVASLKDLTPEEIKAHNSRLQRKHNVNGALKRGAIGRDEFKACEENDWNATPDMARGVLQFKSQTAVARREKKCRQDLEDKLITPEEFKEYENNDWKRGRTGRKKHPDHDANEGYSQPTMRRKHRVDQLLADDKIDDEMYERIKENNWFTRGIFADRKCSE